MSTTRDYLNRVTEPRRYMQLPSMVRRATVLAAISLFSGCMESPRDGQVVRNLGEEMTGRLIATEEGSEMTQSARTSRGC